MRIILPLLILAILFAPNYFYPQIISYNDHGLRFKYESQFAHFPHEARSELDQSDVIQTKNQFQKFFESSL